MSAAADATRLHPVRRALRPERLRAGGWAYQVYVAGLLLVVLASPFFAAVTALTSPQLALQSVLPSAAQAVGALAGAALAAAVVAGRTRGPVHLPPLPAALLGSGPWPRRLSLRRSALTSGGLLLLGVLALAGAPAAALVLTGTSLVQSGALLAGLALLAVVAAVLWLAGQALPRTASAALALALLTLAGLAMVPALAPSTPGGWLTALLTGPAVLWPLVPLALMALLGGAAVPHLLDRLSGPDLLDQARRWERAGIAAGAFDLAAAAGHLRRPPTVGARWPALGSSSWLPWVVLRRDLVGSLRDPERFVLGCLGLLAAGTLGALAAPLAPGLAATVLAGAAGTAYLALGVWAEGYRHVVEAASAPALYGTGTPALGLLHTLLPLCLVVVLGGGGVLAVTLTAGTSATAAALPLLALATALAARLDAAAKGPLPLHLFTPVPTPMGDLSGLNVLAWQASSLLVTTLTAGLIGYAVLLTGPWPLLGFGVVAWVLVARVLRGLNT